MVCYYPHGRASKNWRHFIATVRLYDVLHCILPWLRQVLCVRVCKRERPLNQMTLRLTQEVLGIEIFYL